MTMVNCTVHTSSVIAKSWEGDEIRAQHGQEVTEPSHQCSDWGEENEVVQYQDHYAQQIQGGNYMQS